MAEEVDVIECALRCVVEHAAAAAVTTICAAETVAELSASCKALLVAVCNTSEAVLGAHMSFRRAVEDPTAFHVLYERCLGPSATHENCASCAQPATVDGWAVLFNTWRTGTAARRVFFDFTCKNAEAMQWIVSIALPGLRGLLQQLVGACTVCVSNLARWRCEKEVPELISITVGMLRRTWGLHAVISDLALEPGGASFFSICDGVGAALTSTMEKSAPSLEVVVEILHQVRREPSAVHLNSAMVATWCRAALHNTILPEASELPAFVRSQLNAAFRVLHEAVALLDGTVNGVDLNFAEHQQLAANLISGVIKKALFAGTPTSTSSTHQSNVLKEVPRVFAELTLLPRELLPATLAAFADTLLDFVIHASVSSGVHLMSELSMKKREQRGIMASEHLAAIDVIYVTLCGFAALSQHPHSSLEAAFGVPCDPQCGTDTVFDLHVHIVRVIVREAMRRATEFEAHEQLKVSPADCGVFAVWLSSRFFNHEGRQKEFKAVANLGLLKAQCSHSLEKILFSGAGKRGNELVDRLGERGVCEALALPPSASAAPCEGINPKWYRFLPLRRWMIEGDDDASLSVLLESLSSEVYLLDIEALKTASLQSPDLLNRMGHAVGSDMGLRVHDTICRIISHRLANVAVRMHTAQGDAHWLATAREIAGSALDNVIIPMASRLLAHNIVNLHYQLLGSYLGDSPWAKSTVIELVSGSNADWFNNFVVPRIVGSSRISEDLGWFYAAAMRCAGTPEEGYHYSFGMSKDFVAEGCIAYANRCFVAADAKVLLPETAAAAAMQFLSHAIPQQRSRKYLAAAESLVVRAIRAAASPREVDVGLLRNALIIHHRHGGNVRMEEVASMAIGVDDPEGRAALAWVLDSLYARIKGDRAIAVRPVEMQSAWPLEPCFAQRIQKLFMDYVSFFSQRTVANAHGFLEYLHTFGTEECGRMHSSLLVYVCRLTEAIRGNQPGADDHLRACLHHVAPIALLWPGELNADRKVIISQCATNVSELLALCNMAGVDAGEMRSTFLGLAKANAWSGIRLRGHHGCWLPQSSSLDWVEEKQRQAYALSALLMLETPSEMEAEKQHRQNEHKTIDMVLGYAGVPGNELGCMVLDMAWGLLPVQKDPMNCSQTPGLMSLADTKCASESDGSDDVVDRRWVPLSNTVGESTSARVGLTLYHLTTFLGQASTLLPDGEFVLASLLGHALVMNKFGLCGSFKIDLFSPYTDPSQLKLIAPACKGSEDNIAGAVHVVAAVSCCWRACNDDSLQTLAFALMVYLEYQSPPLGAGSNKLPRCAKLARRLLSEGIADTPLQSCVHFAQYEHLKRMIGVQLLPNFPEDFTFKDLLRSCFTSILSQMASTMRPHIPTTFPKLKRRGPPTELPYQAEARQLVEIGSCLAGGGDDAVLSVAKSELMSLILHILCFGGHLDVTDMSSTPLLRCIDPQIIRPIVEKFPRSATARKLHLIPALRVTAKRETDPVAQMIASGDRHRLICEIWRSLLQSEQAVLEARLACICINRQQSGQAASSRDIRYLPAELCRIVGNFAVGAIPEN